MSLTLDQVKRVAVLARIEISESEAVTAQGHLNDIFGLIEQMQDFARGVVDTRPVVFYLSFTVLFLFLTLKVVESRRWK